MNQQNLTVNVDAITQYTIDGWKLVGHYVKKWFIYQVYVIAIQLAFAIWVGIGFAIVAGFGQVIGISAWIFGGFVFILIPSGVAYIRARESRESPSRDVDPET